MKDFLNIIDQYKEDMIDDISKMVSFESLAKDEDGEFPFGKTVHEAFQCFLDMGVRDGFEIKNVDNYGGHIEFKGEGDEIFAVLGHIDIVPAGDGWDTDPFTAVVKDGKLFGRGTIDDKGPTMAGYYAMKALKEAGFKPNKNIRLIIGLDEETNWKGIKYYMDKEKTPTMGFTPDAVFPVIHGEKGLIIFKMSKSFGESKGEFQLLSCNGGNAPNMVADKVEAHIKGDDITKLVMEFSKDSGYDITSSYDKGVNIVSVKGVSAHGAMPEKGLNAITIFLQFASKLDLGKPMNEFVTFYNEKIGFNFHGENFGIPFEDEPSGKLNFNVGIIQILEDKVELTINIRYPVTFSEEKVYAGIDTVASDWKIEKLDHLDSLYVPKDNELVKVLMDVYREFTGDMENEPIVIGGATYARTVPNCVAFGPVFPHEEEVEHQPNEYVDLNSLIKATKMYAEAIYRLCK